MGAPNLNIEYYSPQLKITIHLPDKKKKDSQGYTKVIRYPDLEAKLTSKMVLFIDEITTIMEEHYESNIKNG